MAVGSAFDAYVKAALSADLWGVEIDLFTTQVEEENREFARVAGTNCLDLYKQTGAYDKLLRLLRSSDCIQMEFTSGSTVNGVPLSGKPDLVFRTREGAFVVFDWKVNGYMSTSKTYPATGYVWASGKGSCHRDCVVWMHRDVIVNAGGKLKEEWESQICVYAWCAGVEVGGEFVAAIDQLVGHGDEVASHRVCISAEKQKALFSEYAELWEIVQSGWIFRDMTEDQSRIRQNVLDQQAAAYHGPHGELMRMMTGRR